MRFPHYSPSLGAAHHTGFPEGNSHWSQQLFIRVAKSIDRQLFPYYNTFRIYRLGVCFVTHSAKTIQYHTDSPAKILFAICFPLVLVNVVLAVTTTWTNQLYSQFVGPDAFSVTGYLSTATTAFSGILSSIVSAAWIKTAHAFAQRDKQNASRQIGNGFLAITIVDVALAVLLLLFADPILTVLHIPEAIGTQAKIYFVLFILSYLPAAIAALFLTIANGTSSSSGIFWINIVIVALNFAAAVILLVCFRLGMVGLSLAAALGAVFQIVFDIFLFRRRGFSLSLRGLFGSIQWSAVWGIIRYGLLIALQSLLCTAGYLLVTYQTNRFLSLEYISVLNVSQPLTGIMSAVNSACLAFSPQNSRPAQRGRLKKFFRLATIFCCSYGVFCFLLYLFLGRWYYGRLFADDAIIAHGIRYWFWYGLGHICLAVAYSIRSFLDSVGLSKLSLLSGIGELLGNLLCAFWLIPCFGTIGRNLAYPIGWFIAAVLLTIAFLRHRKQLFGEPSNVRTPTHHAH